jgi:cytoskeletal protein CcmA (bactofilin family)
VFRKLRTRNISPTQAVKSAPVRSDTVIGAGATLQGTLTTNGNVRVEGTSEGDITAKGNVAVGAAGKVEGNLKGKSVVIGGTVQGDVEATRLSVLGTGRVMGDLTTASLTTQEGGFIQGVITMQTGEAKKKDVKLPAELEAQVVEAVEAGEKKPKK